MVSVVILYLVGLVLTFPLNVCSTFCYFQGEYPIIAVEGKREDLGFAIAMALGFCGLWPILTIIEFLMSGFYKHGLDPRPYWNAR